MSPLPHLWKSICQAIAKRRARRLSRYNSNHRARLRGFESLERREMLAADFGEISMMTLQQPDADAWQTVQMSRDYVDPVVIAGPLSINGSDPAMVRVRNVDAEADTFEVQIDEWIYLDGWHTDETFSYMVVERGTHVLEDGTLLEAGTINMNLDRPAGQEWFTQDFSSSFSDAPVVFSQLASANGPDPAVLQQRGISSGGFQLKLREEEKRDNWHVQETVSWLAIEAGSGENDGNNFLAGNTGKNVTHKFKSINFGSGIFDTAPTFLASMQTTAGSDPASVRYRNLGTSSVQVQIDEETSKDKETKHTAENVGYLFWQKLGEDPTLLFGQAPEVSINANDGSASETAQDQGQFTVSRTGDTTKALTVAYAIGGTAENVTDYLDENGNWLLGYVTIDAGQSEAYITIVPRDDTDAEASETVVLTLEDLHNSYVIGSSATATVTIADNEPVLTISADPALVNENDSSASVQFTVSRSGPTTSPVTAQLQLSGWAKHGIDYEFSGISFAPVDATGVLKAAVTLAAGESSLSFNLTPINDGLAEGDEDVVITVVNQSGSAIATIVDDEPNVSISADAIETTEGAAGFVTFTVTHNGGSESVYAVLRLGADDTATYDADYALSGISFGNGEATLYIPGGSSEATFTLQAIDDGIHEPTENVSISAGGVSGSVAMVSLLNVNANQAPTFVVPATVGGYGTQASPAVRGWHYTKGDELILAEATDPDGNALTYTIDKVFNIDGTVENADGLFAIDSKSGEITLAKQLRQSTLNEYKVRVKVVDDGQPSKSATQDIYIRFVTSVGIGGDTFAVETLGVENVDAAYIHFVRYGRDNPKDLVVNFTTNIGTGAVGDPIVDWSDLSATQKVNDDLMNGTFTLLAGRWEDYLIFTADALDGQGAEGVESFTVTVEPATVPYTPNDERYYLPMPTGEDGDIGAGNEGLETTQTQRFYFLDGVTLFAWKNSDTRLVDSDSASNGGNPGINLNDINQGALNNCFCMASIAAVAEHDWEQIESRFTDLGDGNYEVRLWNDYAGNDGQWQDFTVSSDLNRGSDGAGLSFDVDDSGAVEIWPQLLEKALAQLMSLNAGNLQTPNEGIGYGVLDRGGVPPWAVMAITGDTSIKTEFATRFVHVDGKVLRGKPKAPLNDAQILSQLESHFLPAVITTRDDVNLPGNMISNHLYVVLDIRQDSVGNYLHLYNPHGIDPIYNNASDTTYVKLYEKDFKEVIESIFHVNGDVQP